MTKETKSKPSAQRKAPAQRAPAESPPADAAPAPLSDDAVPVAIFEAHDKKTVTLLRCDVDGHESVENPCPVCGTDKELR